MSTVFLDSFQLIVAVYLLYLAIMGKGKMYHFFDIPQSDQPRVHKMLRTSYLVSGLLALLDAGVNMLQNTMFTQNILETETTITQNFTVDSLPFIHYELLSTISAVLTVLIIVILAGVFIYLRVLSNRGMKDTK
ncbi:MAG: hypothetical protein PHW41_10355 [Eubacteriales bacterium]|nr:hypothetical protein [Eubacteriales bacterium]